MDELRRRLDNGDIAEFEPFGASMTEALENARYDPETQEAVWIQEDYCRPPLAMEREEVLDEYFEDLTVVEKNVDETAGWQRIEELPGLWDVVLGESKVG